MLNTKHSLHNSTLSLFLRPDMFTRNAIIINIAFHGWLLCGKDSLKEDQTEDGWNRTKPHLLLLHLCSSPVTAVPILLLKYLLKQLIHYTFHEDNTFHFSESRTMFHLFAKEVWESSQMYSCLELCMFNVSPHSAHCVFCIDHLHNCHPHSLTLDPIVSHQNSYNGRIISVPGLAPF